ncbi:MAG: undecaprenyl-diphosphate phosphatase [Actinomycetota bacterium]
MWPLTFLDVVILALIQGIGEVLPVSASGHLAVLRLTLGTPEGREAVAVAADLGIVAGLMLYFWRDMIVMAVGLWKLLKRRPDAGSRLLLTVAAGTVPGLLVAWAFVELGGTVGGPMAAAAAMVVFGLFLLIADKLGMTVSRIEHMGFLAAAAIGVLQAAALVAGVSRTGITVTAGRLMGYERAAIARYSLLLAIPVFAVHAGHTLMDLAGRAPLILSADLALAGAAACVGALLSVAAMMAWVDRNSYAPFAVWRILFGAGALAWLVWKG